MDQQQAEVCRAALASDCFTLDVDHLRDGTTLDLRCAWCHLSVWRESQRVLHLGVRLDQLLLAAAEHTHNCPTILRLLGTP